MHSLASLTRKSGLSKRLVQYWCDKDVLEPIAGTGPDTGAPRIFEDGELDILLALRPFAYDNTPAHVVCAVARTLRAAFEPQPEDGGWGDNGVKKAFRAAKQSKEAWLLVIPFQTPAAGELESTGVVEVNNAQIYGITDLEKLGRTLRAHKGLSLPRLVDLTEALRK